MTTCPHCGRQADVHDGRRPGDQPEPGDVSICAYCGGICVFTATGRRKATEQEEAEISKDPRVAAARESLRRNDGDIPAGVADWRRAGLS